MLLSESDERSVLAAMLTLPNGIRRVSAAGVRSTSYLVAQHQRLHESIVDCYIDLQRPIDAISLGNYLIAHDAMDQIGGASFLAEVLGYSSTGDQFEQLLRRCLL